MPQTCKPYISGRVSGHAESWWLSQHWHTACRGMQTSGGRGPAAVPGWEGQWEGALGVPGGCHAYSKTVKFWSASEMESSCGWHFKMRVMDSWKGRSFGCLATNWSPCMQIKYFCKELQKMVPCMMWSSPGKGWSSSGVDSCCPGLWSFFLHWHDSNLILFFNWICWILGTCRKKVFKNMCKATSTLPLGIRLL